MANPLLSASLLTTAIESIYDAAPDPLGWPRALGAIADYFGDVGANLIWRRDDGVFGTIASAGLAAAQKDYDENGWAATDIKATRAHQFGYFFGGEPFTDRHIGEDDEVESHPSYVDFYLKHGLGSVACVAVSPDPHVGVGLAVHRNARMKRPFSDAELEALGRISRHVEKSLRLSVQLITAEQISVGLGEAFARIGMGVFALDGLGRVVFSNPATRLLPKDFFRIADGRLRIGGAASALFDEALIQALRTMEAPSSASPRPILVQDPGSSRRFAIYLLPILRFRLAEQFMTHAHAIALVIEQKPGEPADPAIVRDLLGLTLGEARIAAMVGAGVSPRDAAEKLGIQEDTARTVLKRIFLKTGISRQSELVALLARMVVR